MQPDLEVIRIGQGESFRAFEHGLPFDTVRWHFHPEYELHHVLTTRGRFLVGDHIGSFEPGNLVLVGPNLPHNWVSDVAPSEVIPLRNRVLQFTEGLVRDLVKLLPEMGRVSSLLDRSRSGIQFSEDTSVLVAPRLAEMVSACGARRLELFFGIFDQLISDRHAVSLTTSDYSPDPAVFMTSGINSVLAHIRENLTEALNEDELAEIANLSRSGFCRSFRRHTGSPLVRYVNRLRINLACHLLMSDEGVKVTDVCFASGFNNLSNFNRQFAAHKGMSPTRFRSEILSTMPMKHHLGAQNAA